MGYKFTVVIRYVVAINGCKLGKYTFLGLFDSSSHSILISCYNGQKEKNDIYRIGMLLGIVLYIVFAVSLFCLAYLDRRYSVKYPKGYKTYLAFRPKTISKLSIKKYRLNTKVPYYTPYMVLILCFFTVISAIRFQVGADCETYVESYFAIADNSLHLLEQDFEPAFLWISRALGAVNIGRIGFLGFWAFCEILLFTYSLKDRRYILPYALYILMLSPFFLSWMNGIRQIVVSLVFLLLSIQLIDRNNKIIYIAGILLCSLLHKSALILLPFVFFGGEKMFRWKYLLMGILLCMTALGQTNIVNDYLNILTPILETLNYDNYSDRIDYFASIENGFTVGPRKLIILCLNLTAIWFSDKMKATYNDRFFNWSFNLFFIHACFKDGLLSNASSIFWRPFLYFEVFELITYAYLAYYVIKKYGVKNVVTICVIILMSSYVPLECYAARADVSETSIYKTILSIL